VSAALRLLLIVTRQRGLQLAQQDGAVLEKNPGQFPQELPVSADAIDGGLQVEDLQITTLVGKR
jgi:hypothetical protein